MALPPAPTRPAHDPALYLPIAHLARNRPGTPLDEALRDPAQRRILEFIATEWPKKHPPMIISICRIEQLATEAARHYASAAQANPYPADSAAGGLFISCFEAAKTLAHPQLEHPIEP